MAERPGRMAARRIAHSAGYSLGGRLARANGGAADDLEDQGYVTRGVHQHEAAMHKGKPKTKLHFRDGGSTAGEMSPPRADRGSRRPKDHAGPKINILVAPHGQNGAGAGAGPAGEPPRPPMPPQPPPMPPPGAGPPRPMMPGGGMPMGAGMPMGGPPMGLPPRPPGMNRGGRIRRQMGGGMPVGAGAMPPGGGMPGAAVPFPSGGIGAIGAGAGARPPGMKRGGDVGPGRTHPTMTAGAGSGPGRIQKSHNLPYVKGPKRGRV